MDPGSLGLHCEILEYPSLDGKKITALYFPAEGTPKGTVVHFHGNFGNVSNHFLLAVFLIKRGFDVIAFDYEGYGASQGKPTPRRTIEDGVATVRYAQSRLRNPKTGVGVFGQSLGGAVAILVAAREPEVRAAVIESAFSSYRGMCRTALKRHAITWPLSLFIPYFIGTSHDPIDYVDRIAPRPILLIHGDRDEIVPVDMSRALFQKAREPKTLWIIQGANHLERRRVTGQEYEYRIADFFTQALAL